MKVIKYLVAKFSRYSNLFYRFSADYTKIFGLFREDFGLVFTSSSAFTAHVLFMNLNYYQKSNNPANVIFCFLPLIVDVYPFLTQKSAF